MKRDYFQEEEIELVEIPLNGDTTHAATDQQPTDMIEEEEKIEVSEGEKKR
jgi:hypothetical protein